MTAEDADPAPFDAGLGGRSRLWVGAAVLAVAALATAGFLVDRDDSQPAASGKGVGRPAPAIDLPALTGEGRITLASFRGRPVVVNLFASWCVPCRKELPAFQSLSQDLGDRVAFLGVNHQDDREGGRQMLADFGIRYPAGYDPDGKVAADYGLFGMPTTLFVGADGRLLETHTGEISRSQLEAAIARHFD